MQKDSPKQGCCSLTNKLTSVCPPAAAESLSLSLPTTTTKFITQEFTRLGVESASQILLY